MDITKLIILNKNNCISCNECIIASSKIFKLDSEELVDFTKEASAEIEKDNSLINEISDAILLCPTEAIKWNK